MDEHTLNDLLECSVCLERLDTSSKVLPCQHTFCRKCLEVIVSSHNELRCPECRILVDIKIDELPPNVLLMRILEGMKQAAAAVNSKNQPQNDNNSKLDEKQKSTEKLRTQQVTQKLQQLSPTTTTTAASLQTNQQQQQPRRCLLPHAYALFDFVTTEPTDLNFKKGDLLLLKRRIDNNWYVGQSNGKEGTFPINYVQIIIPLPTPQCIALYDFKMGPNEEEGCLNFKKGTLINVIRRIDHNWAEGRIGSTIGIFPIAFVELNTLAKQLLDSYVSTTNTVTSGANSQQQQHVAQTTAASAAAAVRNLNNPIQQRNLPPVPFIDPTTETNSSSTSTSNTTSPNTQSAASSNSSSSNCSPHQSLPSTPQHRNNTNTAHGGSVRYRDKGAKEKRHSLNALLSASANGQPPALSLIQTNRHSAEILSLPHELNIPVTTDNTATRTQISARSRSVGNEMPKQCSAQTLPETTTTEQQNTQFTRVLKTGATQQIPPTLPWGYLALYPYKSRKSDELELKKGCVYIVTEYCLDGWFKGKNWQDVSGVFPGNYVTPLRARDQQQLMHQWKYVPQATQVGHTEQQTSNMKISNLLPHQPPDLPPRQVVANVAVASAAAVPSTNATTTTCSVWTKPLGQTVEAFFNRNKTNSAVSGNNSTNEVKERKENVPNVTTSTAVTSATGGAVSLMKRLTHIKSRSKSPGAQLQQQQQQQQRSHQSNADQVKGTEETNQHAVQLHPVHVRSGSCPSQLLQSLPNETSAAKNQRAEQLPMQQQTAVIPTNITYGSQRIKSNKERPHLVCARQSLDAATFRSMFNNATATAATTVYVQQPPPQTKPQAAHLTSQLHANMIIAPSHRKSQSLDAGNVLNSCNNMIVGTATVGGGGSGGGGGGNGGCVLSNTTTAACPISEAAIKASATTKSTQCTRESRFRCVVPYPPNSEIELELHVGDIIYVQRKQKNGWYKGTHARTNKTGLFPASFVEPDV